MSPQNSFHTAGYRFSKSLELILYIFLHKPFSDPLFRAVWNIVILEESTLFKLEMLYQKKKVITESTFVLTCSDLSLQDKLTQTI